MAESKTQIERRLDRLELAIGTMANWLAQTSFNRRAAEDIEKILRGEIRKPRMKPPKEKNEDASTESSTT